jgi:hypothetical protein
MTEWNFDLSQAPRGRKVASTVTVKGVEHVRDTFVPAKVILATKCRKVTLSHWLPDEERWLMLAKGEQPKAWHAWPQYPEITESDEP